MKACCWSTNVTVFVSVPRNFHITLFVQCEIVLNPVTAVFTQL